MQIKEDERRSTELPRVDAKITPPNPCAPRLQVDHQESHKSSNGTVYRRPSAFIGGFLLSSQSA
jgi:hypothetical protein